MCKLGMCQPGHFTGCVCWARAGLGVSRDVCFSSRGHKRKLNEDAASESSRESSCEDEEGSSSEADEMAAALEAELSDLM